jgi:ERCC4-type nuclease
MIFFDSRTFHSSTVGGVQYPRFSPNFLARFNGLAMSTELEHGDANFFAHESYNGAVCLEFTKAVNLAESVVHSGRIVEQARTAKSAGFSQYFLMVCGDLDCDGDGHLAVRWWDQRVRKTVLRPVQVPGGSGPVLYQAVDNFLNSLVLLCGVQVKRSRDEAELARQVLDLYLWFSRPLEDHSTTLSDRFYVSDFLGVEIPLIRRVAKEYKGVSTGRSKALAARFKTPREFVDASVEELMGVDGVGKKLAESMWAQSNGRSNGNGTH